MEHLIIGAAQAAHIREYARSWLQATATRPRVCAWTELGEASRAVPLPPGPLAVRLAAPTAAERAALARLGGAAPGAAEVEAAPAGVTGLLRAAATLDEALAAQGVVPCYATPPRALGLLLDRELRAQWLERDSVPQPGRWALPPGGAHQRYEVLRDRLRQAPGKRVWVRLRRDLGEGPAVLLWQGGRGLRAQANCRFTPAGAALAPVHPIEDEAALRPLLGRLFELGAIVQEDWAGAEIEGRPFVLSLLAVGPRVALGVVGAGGPWAQRGQPPEPGVPGDLPGIRRHIQKALYQQIEETCVALARACRCAGLVVDLALTRRFDGFAVLDIDPFADLPADRRDALGWTGYDHLVRGLRALAEDDRLGRTAP